MNIILKDSRTIKTSNYLTDDKLKELIDPEANLGIPTGISELDRIIRGIKPGLYVLSAQRGIGKTWFALQLAKALWESAKVKTTFFSLEMLVDDLHRRCLQSFSDLTEDEFLAGKDTAKAQELLQQDIIAFHPSYDQRFGYETFEAEVERGVQAGQNLFILDHLHLVPGAGGTNANEVISHWSSEAKQLANRLNTTILFIAQPRKLNSSSRVISADDIKGSGSLADSADVIITLSKDRGDPKSGEITETWLSVEKNRLGGKMFEGFHLQLKDTGVFCPETGVSHTEAIKIFS